MTKREQQLDGLVDEYMELRDSLKNRLISPEFTGGKHLTPKQETAIEFIKKNPVHAPIELARGLGIDRSNAGKLLKALIKAGAVQNLGGQFVVVREMTCPLR